MITGTVAIQRRIASKIHPQLFHYKVVKTRKCVNFNHMRVENVRLESVNGDLLLLIEKNHSRKHSRGTDLADSVIKQLV